MISKYEVGEILIHTGESLDNPPDLLAQVEQFVQEPTG